MTFSGKSKNKMPKAETSGVAQLPLNQVDYCLEFQYYDIEGMGDADIANKMVNQVNAWMADETNQLTIAESVKFCVWVAEKDHPNASGKNVADARIKFKDNDDPNKPIGVRMVVRFWMGEEHTEWKMFGAKIKINNEEFFENE